MTLVSLGDSLFDPWSMALSLVALLSLVSGFFAALVVFQVACDTPEKRKVTVQVNREWTRMDAN